MSKALGKDTTFVRDMCLSAPSLLNRRTMLISDRWKLYKTYASYNPLWEKQIEGFGPHTVVKLMKVGVHRGVY